MVCLLLSGLLWAAAPVLAAPARLTRDRLHAQRMAAGVRGVGYDAHPVGTRAFDPPALFA
jgi:hypothetical protein